MESAISAGGRQVSAMDDELKQTVRLVRRARVTTDDRGRTVWSGPVEDAELELVSTQMLQQMLGSEDARQREALQRAAEQPDGVLARNMDSDRFEVIDDDDLKAALSSAAADTGPARSSDVVYEPVSTLDEGEELSLVSTQMLRRMLGDEEPDSKEDEPVQPGGGFDPYNSG